MDKESSLLGQATCIRDQMWADIKEHLEDIERIRDFGANNQDERNLLYNCLNILIGESLFQRYSTERTVQNLQQNIHNIQ